MADAPRTWITREEIAEIFDARIKKLVTAISMDRLTVLGEMEAGSKIGMMQFQASTVRANDKLFRSRVGERV